MNVDEKVELVKRGTVEVLTIDELKKLFETRKEVYAYYGRAPTGTLHMGHLTTLSKVFDFERAGIKNKILIANIHAALDDLKSPWDDIYKRAELNMKCIELAFPWKSKPEFVMGDEFQLDKDYQLDNLKLSTIITVSRATRAASEVTRMKNPKVSELIYPMMQALDEEYLGVDIQLGGIDQRHIFTLAREFLPKIGYKSRVEVMTPLIASLKGPGVKMSSSIPETVLKVYDSEESVKKKIKNAYCPEGVVKDNPILQLSKYMVFVVKGRMFVERPAKFGGDVTFNSYEELERAFSKKELHPMDLKNALTRDLIELFKPVRSYFAKRLDFLKDLGPQFMP